MRTVVVPYHLDQRLAGFDVGLPADVELSVDLPAGDPWQRMAVLYEQVAGAVSRHRTPPLVVPGDCTTSLGVLAGLQRAGHDVGIVWFDAHADFHTERTTSSGYVGGFPLALAAGIGVLTLPEALGLRPVPEPCIVLVDARDTDPGEHDLLERSSVVRTTVADLAEHDLPDEELYLHIDVDVCDPGDVRTCGTRPPVARRSSRCSPRFNGSAPPAGSPPSGSLPHGTQIAPAGPFTSVSYGAFTRRSSTTPSPTRRAQTNPWPGCIAARAPLAADLGTCR